MAHRDGGKIRNRRVVKDAPYDRRSRPPPTLMNRVKDTVKGIVPHWLKNFFENGGSPEGRPAQNCQPCSPNIDETGPPSHNRFTIPEPRTGDADRPATSASHIFQEHVLSRPPLNRSRLHFSPLEISTPVVETHSNYFQQPSTSSASGPFFKELSPSPIKEMKDNVSQHEDDNISTTSGFSSRDSDKDVPASKPPLSPQRKVEMDRSSSAPLFSPTSSRKPSFNLSVFGSPHNSLLKSTANSRQLGDSPFYRGKTMYGGAAASCRSRADTPYQAPIRKLVKIRPASAQPCGVTSATAKRFLQSLEQMSSPLADAKRIPSAGPSPLSSSLDASNHSFLRFQAKNKQLASPLSPAVKHIPTPKLAPLNNSLSVRPSLTLEKTLKPLPLVSEAATEPSRSTTKPAVPAVPLPHSYSPSAMSAGGGKMKRMSTRHRQAGWSSTKVSTESTSVKELPTSVDTSFCFSTPPAFAPLSIDNTSKSSDYKFSQDTAETSKLSTPTSATFTFAPPCLIPVTSAVANFNPVNETQAITTAVKHTVTQSAEDFEGPFRPAKTLKQGSVLDVLKSPGFSSSLSQTSTSSLNAHLATSPSSTPSFTSTTASSLSTSSGFGNLNFKAPGGWSCNNCLVQNKPLDTKCVCCKATNPKCSDSTANASDGVGTVSSIPNGTSNTFGIIFSKPTGTWDCDTCLVQNKPDAVKCVACETAKPGTGLKPSFTLPSAFSAVKTASLPTAPVSPISTMTIPAASTALAPTSSVSLDLGDKFKKAEGSWECDTCMIVNKAEDKKCVACSSVKPGASAAATTGPSLSSTTAPVFGFGDKFKKSEGSWECDTCMVTNQADASKCVACSAAKPGLSSGTLSSLPSAPSSAPLSSFGDVFKKAEGSWECDACMVVNKATDAKCVACASAKPGAPSTAVPSAAPTFGFGDKFKKTEGSWDCDACLLQNKAADVKCAACQAAKPGAKADATAAGTSDAPAFAASPFKFGASSGSGPAFSGFKTGDTTESSAAPFKFGAQFGSSSEPSVSDNSASTGFKFSAVFGETAGSDKPPVFGAGASGGFAFGQSTPSSTASSAPTFMFGQNSDSKTASAPSAAPAFSFGQTQDSKTATVAAAAPAPSVSQSEDTKAAAAAPPPFTFGQNLDSKAAAASSEAPSFTFGQSQNNKPTAAAPTFTFGQNMDSKSAAPAPAAAPAFTFGQTQDSKAAPAAAPAFTFGQNQESKPAVAPSFSFGQSQDSKPSAAPAAAPTFTFGQSQDSKGPAAAPTFTFGQNQDNSGAASLSASASFAFGQDSKVPALSSTPAPAFTFGQNQENKAPVLPAPGPFVFGQSQDSKAAAPSAAPAAAPTFIFGQNQESKPAAAPAAAPTFVFGAAGSTAAAAPSFNFGSTAPPAAPSTGFSFGGAMAFRSNPSTAPQSGTPGMFSIGVSDAADAQTLSKRKIKAAVRRRR
ncbi:nuclear pore complex protein Nup153 [Synchiropus splendidus]|uniref:nuclear pore complex protein Nup153 n=1 Tax=Synchiropus splendidus TaxID=270530 RepID=UPI00237D986E|nr:nuclear pore complex protein Nup153 [Synchiropus splendidus]